MKINIAEFDRSELETVEEYVKRMNLELRKKMPKLIKEGMSYRQAKGYLLTFPKKKN